MSKFVLDSKTRELCGVNVRVRQDEFICLNDILYIVDSERIKEKLRPNKKAPSAKAFSE